MPIDIESYRQINTLTNEEQIVAFLFEHRDKAYKAAEIAERTGISKGCTSKRLTVLRKMGIVSNKTLYWTIDDPIKALDYLQDKEIVEITSQAALGDFQTSDPRTNEQTMTNG
ncbi:winged helix-turn-helix domain-containing protein [Haloterrigena alkaliphila]|uniref:Winged helix-turn-helix transcriptional regulator n=1 Tax=Haloterrigena alkaliphila TaxID=2816475 RepID=A0A8A2VIJ8_9EURY|nr:winged helix-turn-helix domain-containing protein [Haloterrigena alkaliphila]QSX00468.1 winged helix-turn-helix domain-containing protein [Haloterrigena alkaliphila]